MTDDNNQTTEEESDLPPALARQVEEMVEDDTVDFDSRSRQNEGWIRLYVECPDCETPMARVMMESESLDTDEASDATQEEHHAVCPDCGVFATRIQVTRVTEVVNDIKDAFDSVVDDAC